MRPDHGVGDELRVGAETKVAAFRLGDQEGRDLVDEAVLEAAADCEQAERSVHLVVDVGVDRG